MEASLQEVLGTRADFIVVGSVGLLLSVAAGAIARRWWRGRDADRLDQARAAALCATLRSLGDAVIATDLAGGITFMNPAAEAATGWPAHEAEGRPLDDVLRLLDEGTHAAVESPTARVLRAGHTLGFENPTLLLARGGRKLPIEDSGARILDAHGHCIGVVIVFRDVSGRQAAEEERLQIARDENRPREEARIAAALRESKRQFERLATASPVGIFRADRAGEFVYVNPQWCHISGMDAVAAMGSGWRAALHPEDRPRLLAEWEATSRAPREFRAEFRIRRPDGELRWVMGQAHPEADASGEFIGFVGTVTDVTPLKEAEQEREDLLDIAEQARAEAERASLAKDQFLAMLSHELRSPLAAIVAWLGIMRRKLDDPQLVARALEVVERNVWLQSGLIAGLLDVSRIAAGKLHLDSASVDLSAELRLCLDTLQPGADTKAITIVRDIPPGPCLIDGDAARLGQIYRNLVENALKFTPRGGTIHVRLAGGADAVEVAVTDSGEGFPPELAPALFEPFRQAHPGGSGRQRGLGLGLTIVRHLVEAHGGTITASSPGPGRGATFTARLPLVASNVRLASPTTPTPPADALAGLRVLIVEDHVDWRDALALQFTQHGADVTTAENSTDALAHFDRTHPHIVISDITLPDGDGYGLIRELRARPTPLLCAVTVTGVADAESRQRCLALGFDAFVAKPCDPQRVLETVQTLVAAAGSPNGHHDAAGPVTASPSVPPLL